MYTQTISDPLWQLLKRFDRFPELTSGYLGGGTALALQLGHRRSDDLDFTGNNPAQRFRSGGTAGLRGSIMEQPA